MEASLINLLQEWDSILIAQLESIIEKLFSFIPPELGKFKKKFNAVKEGGLLLSNSEDLNLTVSFSTT
jgi:hypothetical protein